MKYGTLLTALLLVVILAAPALAVNYTFSGSVICNTGAPVPNAQVLVRYVYVFQGVAAHEGRDYLQTDATGHYVWNTDITNIWGDGPLLSLEAWSWFEDQERYINCGTWATSFVFAPFRKDCGPIDPPDPNNP